MLKSTKSTKPDKASIAVARTFLVISLHLVVVTPLHYSFDFGLTCMYL